MTSPSSASDGMDKSIEEALRRSIAGDLHFDPISKRIYSVDASIYEVEPIGVVVPRCRDDLVAIAAIAADYEVPLIARGAATGVTGGCIGKGLIVDTSKYLNNIIEINAEAGYVRCEPGVVQDALNSALASHELRLGPDTSTGNRATVGGMAANNAAGAHSLIYGTMADHLDGVTLILSGGETLNLASTTPVDWEKKCLLNNREGEIYRTLKAIRDRDSAVIAERYPAIPRHVSGYNLAALTEKEPFNICKLIAGSEGTLGIIAEMTLTLSPRLQERALCLLYFDDMNIAMEAVEEILSYGPIAVEMVDNTIIEAGRHAPPLRGRLEWLQSTPEALFIVEFEGTHSTDLQSRLERFAQAMHNQRPHLVSDTATIRSVWELRKAGLGLLLSKRAYSRAIAFIEDVAVAPQQLAPFIKEFRQCVAAAGKDTGIYGHVGSGCMHLRPFIDLRRNEEVATMKQLMETVADLIIAYGGSMSGEHGDGMARSWLNERLFGPRLYRAFCEVKAAFDPEGLMNPNTIVYGPPPDASLRLDPTTSIVDVPTFQDFTREGGFALAVDLCNGNGQCRQTEGVMCPSFQASGDEYDTTRARAQTLRAIVNGKEPLTALTSEGVADVLDLCLECKGCKGECPSQVDMAKIKAELLYQRQEKEGHYSLRSRLFGHIATLNSWMAPLARWLPPIPKGLTTRLGIAPERTLPTLAPRPFSSWWRRHPRASGGTPLLLFVDTFTEFNSPHIAISAVTILEALGYSVEVVTRRCCGRPLISKGLLRQARKKAEAAVRALYPYSDRAIVSLEPSCLHTLQDDLWPLLDNPTLKEQADAITAAITPFDQIVARHTFTLKEEKSHQILVHGHCHQKSCGTLAPTLALLNAIEGVTAREIPSGCCGMAGSFGYESEHYTTSMEIGELILFPAIRNSDALIIADGTSCRQQIIDGTGRHPLHLAEFLANATTAQS